MLGDCNRRSSGGWLTEAEAEEALLVAEEDRYWATGDRGHSATRDSVEEQDALQHPPAGPFSSSSDAASATSPRQLFHEAREPQARMSMSEASSSVRILMDALRQPREAASSVQRWPPSPTVSMDGPPTPPTPARSTTTMQPPVTPAPITPRAGGGGRGTRDGARGVAAALASPLCSPLGVSMEGERAPSPGETLDLSAFDEEGGDRGVWSVRSSSAEAAGEALDLSAARQLGRLEEVSFLTD